MKLYTGLDVSMKTTNICIVDQDTKIIFESCCATDPDAITRELQPYIENIETVGLEAGAMCFWLIDGLKDNGLPAVCLDSRQVANILKTIINKTDKNDARGIARIVHSQLYTTVHQRSKTSQEVGMLMTIRSGLVADRTRKKNRIRGTLKSYGIRLKAVGNSTFIDQVRVAIAGLSDKTKAVLESALKDYQSCETGINELEEQVQEAVKTHSIVRVLQTVEGIGPITALSYMAEIDDPMRFKDNPEDVGAYLGLTPRQYSSGETVRLGGISKAGSNSMRVLLYEAAVVLLTRTKGFSKLKSWGLRLCKKKPFKVAATAVARKLAVIMIRMWQTGEVFRFSDKQEKKEDSLISSKKPIPIGAKEPVGVKAKPCGLASLGLDSQQVSLAT